MRTSTPDASIQSTRHGGLATGHSLAAPPGGPATRNARTATLIAASLGFAIVQLDVTVVNVAVRQIGLAFHGGVSELQWVIDAYTLTFAASILTAGAIGDRLGARRTFISGFVVFVSASVACGLAPAIAVLIAARAAQGVGAALLGSCSLALLNHTFADDRHRSRAIGFWAAGASAALSGGPVVGGVLIAVIGWRAIFFINVPIGLAGLWLTRRYARETPQAKDRQLDLPGQLTAMAALAALAAATIEAGTHGFADPRVVAGLTVAALSAGAFVAIQARGRVPMLPLSLFRRGAFTAPTLIGLLVNVCFYGLIFLFSLLFQVVHGYSALRAGLAFLPMTAAIMGANLLSGRVARLAGPRRTILLGLAMMAAGCAALLWTGNDLAYAATLAQQVLLGAGLGLLVPPMTGVLMGSVERSRSGVAAGTLNTLRQTGSMLGIAAFGSLVAGPGHFLPGLRGALVVSLAVLGAAAALTPLIDPRSG